MKEQLGAGLDKRAKKWKMALVTHRTLRIAIVAVCRIASNMIQFSTQYSRVTGRTLEVVVMETLLQLLHEDTLAVHINQTMTKRTSGHF